MPRSPASSVSPPSSPFNSPSIETDRSMGLSSLPYDLLLNIAIYLDLHDIHALHLTCKSLHDFASTRHVYRKLAHDLLGRCRALPLKGFQRLSDLSTDQLIRAVNKASRLEIAWRRRAPCPIQARDAISELYDDYNYGPESSDSRCSGKARRKWFKIVSAPPNEEVDWLSPITSKYTLCATKSGKVVCWDVETDECLAEWCPSERWELWKCRVEFEQRTVFFTMAKVLQGSYDDDRIMEFVLMKLEFFDSAGSPPSPVFSHISSFKTAGVVMNVFLLDPSQRLLSAFVWLLTSNTIGLYVLLDWDKAEYVFIDTGMEGVMSSNWSCILFEKNIVIHCEESNSAFQHFYPIPLLRKYKRKIGNKSSTPFLIDRLSPARTFSRKFIFPKLAAPFMVLNHAPLEGDLNAFGGFANAILTPGGLLLPLPPDIATNLNAGLMDGGPVDLAQILTPQQLEQLFAQAPLITLLPPDQNPPALAPPLQLDQNAPLPAQTAGNHHPPAAPATQPANGGAVAQAGMAGAVNGANNGSSDTEDGHEGEGPDQDSFPNPFPLPWYPESAHFVRQWWPTLPGVPRVSCTVVLLAVHHPQTHATRFVLAQHYFRVPLDWKSWKESQQMAACSGKHKEMGKKRQRLKLNGVNGNARTLINGVNNNNGASVDQAPDHLEGSGSSSSSSPSWADGHDHSQETHDPDCDVSEAETECECGWAGEQYDNMSEEDDVDNSMKMWYVPAPFDVVCVSDGEDEEGQQMERPRPLIAVDFGHAVWIEFADNPGEGEEGGGEGGGEDDDASDVMIWDDDEEDEEEEEQAVEQVVNGTGDQSQGGSSPRIIPEPMRLRFVTFPPYDAWSLGPSPGEGKMEGVVRTLKVPDELDLDSVETINIDQSQGAVILSVKEGRIFILCYE